MTVGYPSYFLSNDEPLTCISYSSDKNILVQSLQFKNFLGMDLYQFVIDGMIRPDIKIYLC